VPAPISITRQLELGMKAETCESKSGDDIASNDWIKKLESST
jgi:hypothetical protein